MNQEVQEPLYDESEVTRVRFVGFATEKKRYDLGFVYTHMFFDHPLIICMQTGRSALLSQCDVERVGLIREVFALDSNEEAEAISDFLRGQLPEESFVAEVERQ